MTATADATARKEICELINKDNQGAIQETPYLMSTPGMAESLLQSHSESNEDFLTAEELEW